MAGKRELRPPGERKVDCVLREAGHYEVGDEVVHIADGLAVRISDRGRSDSDVYPRLTGLCHQQWDTLQR